MQDLDSLLKLAGIRYTQVMRPKNEEVEFLSRYCWQEKAVVASALGWGPEQLKSNTSTPADVLAPEAPLALPQQALLL